MAEVEVREIQGTGKIQCPIASLKMDKECRQPLEAEGSLAESHQRNTYSPYLAARN